MTTNLGSGIFIRIYVISHTTVVRITTPDCKVYSSTDQYWVQYQAGYGVSEIGLFSSPIKDTLTPDGKVNDQRKENQSQAGERRK